jgi:predicted acetyltransferase
MADIEITKVNRQQKAVLWNILQKYLYEMTRYYENAMGSDGNFPYRYFEAYFENEPGREAFFILDDKTVVGFAMINTHSFNGNKVDHCLAEFTVFPAFRHKGVATAAIKKLLFAEQGKWQLKYSTVNEEGMHFWKNVLLPYHPLEEKLEGNEFLVSFISC